MKYLHLLRTDDFYKTESADQHLSPSGRGRNLRFRVRGKRRPEIVTNSTSPSSTLRATSPRWGEGRIVPHRQVIRKHLAYAIALRPINHFKKISGYQCSVSAVGITSSSEWMLAGGTAMTGPLAAMLSTDDFFFA